MLDTIKDFFLPSLSEINPDENRPIIRVGILALTEIVVSLLNPCKTTYTTQIAYLSRTFC